MAARRFGISGLAVFLGTTGVYLAYAGIKNVGLTDGLRDLLQGKVPEGNTKPYVPVGGPTSESQVGVESAEGGLGGPVPESATRLVPGTSIRVHTSIYGRVVMMVAAAKAVGLTLDGWGWRSVDEQRKRRAELGYTSDSQASGSGGRTPAARPGHSMHERGLAIDFKGMQKGDRAYTWLKANAARFGLHNLPSEPWHWSTNGH